MILSSTSWNCHQYDFVTSITVATRYYQFLEFPKLTDYPYFPISPICRFPELTDPQNFLFWGLLKIVFQSIRKFIEDELKSCARKDVYIKRLGRLADNIKINAPVLTKPPKRKGKKGKKGKQRGWFNQQAVPCTSNNSLLLPPVTMISGFDRFKPVTTVVKRRNN